MQSLVSSSATRFDYSDLIHMLNFLKDCCVSMFESMLLVDTLICSGSIFNILHGFVFIGLNLILKFEGWL